MDVPTLLLSHRFSDDSNRLWKAAIESGWNVHRLTLPEVGTFPEDALADAIYGETLFVQAFQVARPDVSLRELSPTWLTTLPREFLGRIIRVEKLSEARRRQEPVFVKPTVDKQFEAKVYDPRDELVAPFVDGDPDVLVSGRVQFNIETRVFCLPSGMVTGSVYERDGALNPDVLGEFLPPVREVIGALQHGGHLPAPTVVDVGRLTNGKWVVIEANPAWGSGLYACDPHGVLRVLTAGFDRHPTP